MSVVRVTKMGRLHTGSAEVFLQALKGTPLLDANDRAVLDDAGKPIMIPPTAAMMKVIVEFLKNNGIDREPEEGSVVDSVAKKIQQYDDTPLELEGVEEAVVVPEDSQKPS